MKPPKTISIVCLMAKEIGLQCFNHLLSLNNKWNLNIIGLKTNDQVASGSNMEIIKKAQTLNIPILKSLDDIPPCDYIISVQYHEILKTRHIQQAKIRAINLHLAPLPEYRGCNQFSFAIYNQEQEFGVALHEINEQVDDGDLIAEFRWKIPLDIWVEELWETANQKGLALFQETFPLIFEKPSLTIPKKQVGSRMYLRKDIHQLKELLWNESPEIWKRKIRATSMPGFEPPYFILDGKKIFVGKEKA